MGVIGLGYPVFSIRTRANWIGWTPSARAERLRNVMDAFVLGTVHPCCFLLCGKLVPMLVASDVGRATFKRKYGAARSIIKQRDHDGRLALLTPPSALRRSSVHNRVRFGERLLYRGAGFARGSGDSTAKQKPRGMGFLNHREVIRKVVAALGLSGDWVYHGVEREVFVIPLAENAQKSLQGQRDRLRCYKLSQIEILEYLQDRWLFSRVAWDKRFKPWSKNDWTIWSKKDVKHGSHILGSS